MGLLARILGIGASAGDRAPERRATSWDLMRGIGTTTQAGVPVGPYLAENLSAVFACVQCISETTACLPVGVFRKSGDGKVPADDHPVARLFKRAPNTLQTPVEFLEMMTAHCLLRGNAYCEIERDNRGAPVALWPLHPDYVSVLRLTRSRNIVYDVTDPAGGTRRLVADEVLHLKDRSDDGIVGKARLTRARETFGIALATETHAAKVFANSAALSGVLMHPGDLGVEGAQRLSADFKRTHQGPEKAGEIAVLEEGMKWQAISVSPEATELLASRQFSIETIARIFRVPPPVLGDLSHGTYSNVTELGRWFYQHTIVPWLTRWERTIERSLFSDEARRTYEVEFDADVLTRANMLERYQSYRIAREIGLNSANELRKYENMNPRTDPGGDEFFSPANMQSEQTGAPKQGQRMGPIEQRLGMLERANITSTVAQELWFSGLEARIEEIEREPRMSKQPA
jgi:HK97 family phage portal protein